MKVQTDVQVKLCFFFNLGVRWCGGGEEVNKIKLNIFWDATTQIGPKPLTVEVTRSYSDTQHPVGLIWTSDQPVAETST
jgi:hypothetical protein